MSLIANQTIEGPSASGAAAGQPVAIGYTDGGGNVQSASAATFGTVGAANLAVGPFTTSGSAQQLVAARATRRSVTIKNTDASITVYVGPATVTSGNGFPLKAGESVTLPWTGLVQVIAASGTPVVAYADAYD